MFIPSPNVAEDHQTKNALAITAKNAAILLRQNELESKFQDELESLIQDDNRRKTLGNVIKTLALPDATKHIVDEVEKLLLNRE